MEKYIVDGLDTPYFIVDEALIVKNLDVLADVKARTGCKILLAQKAFSMYTLYPLISGYLDGTCASGLHEARLAHEYFTGENHVFSPAYIERDFAQIVKICDHVVFNSFGQWERFKKLSGGVVCGIRVNPELSTQDNGIYDPCAPGSRLGVRLANFRADLLDGISGLHFHTLCQQNFDALDVTLVAFEERFGKFLHEMDWVNFGGGHHITREDYDVAGLVDAVNRVKSTYRVQVYLEPGEAVALNAGFLVASVADIVENGGSIAILDASAACHMPDVLEMPYRPFVVGSGKTGEKPHGYRLGGPSCLAGDVIGDYSFDEPLKIGDKLIFTDMAIYSMVKTNTFNGVKLPDLAVLRLDGRIEIVKRFGYEDFLRRL